MFDLNCRPLATYAHIAHSFVRVYSDKKVCFILVFVTTFIYHLQSAADTAFIGLYFMY